MNQHDREIDSIFEQALEIESHVDRDAFLKRHCGENTELLQQVQSLLVANKKMDAGFLDQTNSLASQPKTVERVGSVIGPYKLMEQIGEGGMGVVYIAEQRKPVRRRVALKIIKPGMDTKEVMARFSAERQALAMMDHPNIARVLDAGETESGHPFFVMELVKGTSITEYCDQQKLSASKRLRLFQDVCSAIQHAHQKGIIHRDIKPNNVLVASADGKPFVKVIDFGVAKAINQQLTEQTVYTQLSQLVGTPMYMSPEQAGMSSIDVDTRSDIYSLGVLLYELLTGSTPFDKSQMKEAAFEEMRRIIREVDPPKPSTKISSLGLAASDISLHRQTDPRKLCQSLRGDLDWIVMKALEKDRQRRYETANGFSADINRYLNSEPVTAGPPGASYRIGKFIQRNRSAVVASVVVTTTLVLGMIGTTWGMMWALSERAKVVSQAQTASKAILETNALVEQSARKFESEFDNQTLSRVLSKSAKQMQGDEVDSLALATKELASGLVDSLENEARSRRNAENIAEFQAKQLEDLDAALMGTRLRNSLLDSVRKYGIRVNMPQEELDKRVAEVDRLISGADFTGIAADSLNENVFDKALEAIDRDYGEQPLVQARLLESIGGSLSGLGLYEEAQSLIERALEIRREKLGDDHPDTLHSIHKLGYAMRNLQKYNEAMALFDEAYNGRLRLFGEDHEDTMRSLNGKSIILFSRGDYDEAGSILKKVLDFRLATLGVDHESTIELIFSLACFERVNNQYEEAESHFREALNRSKACEGYSKSHIANYARGLGIALQVQGKMAEAETMFRTALAILREQLGNDHPITLNQLSTYATFCFERGQWDESLKLMDEALAGQKKTLGPKHPDTLSSLNKMGFYLRQMGKPNEGEAFIREALEGYLQMYGEDNASVLDSCMDLGYHLHMQHRYAESEPLLQKAFEGFRRIEGEDGSNSITAERYLGNFFAAQNKLDKAEQLLRVNLARTERVQGPNHRDTLLALGDLAQTLENNGKLEESEKLQREALRRLTQHYGELHFDTLRSAGNLANVLVSQGKDAEAETLYRKNLELEIKVLGEEHNSTLTSINNLGYLLNKLGQYEEAEELLAKYEAVVRRVYPEAAQDFLGSYLLKLGDAQIGTRKYQAAESTLSDAFPMLVKGFGKTHKKTLKCMELYVQLYQSWNDVTPDKDYVLKANQWQEKLDSSQSD